MSGRPTVITDEVVRKLEAAFRDGFSLSEACLVSGVSRTAYYERKAVDEVFANKMELANKYVTIRAKKVVVKAIDDGNFNAAKWWLEHRERDEFGLKAINQKADLETDGKKDDEYDPLSRMLANIKEHGNAAIERVSATY
jgi:hypothetical protein